MLDRRLIKIAEGKTKEIYGIEDDKDVIFVKSKDDITAFNAVRKNTVEGKADIANETTCNVFEYLNALGFKTHYISFYEHHEGKGFLATRCQMIPLEWVARRLATGSFLKRNQGVIEGYRFTPPKIEVFYKDDANNDPQWSFEQILGCGFNFNGRKIGEREVAMMKKATETVFRVLEKAWLRQNCVLVDMKMEFGVTTKGEILIADVIDNDSWRVWPAGDRLLQLDKQFYRDLEEVNDEALLRLKENYKKVAEITKGFTSMISSRIVIIMGSASDIIYANRVSTVIESYGIAVTKRIASAHKTTDVVLKIIAECEGDNIPTVFIAVAGRSNGLGPVIAGNTVYPVINAPPCSSDWVAQDIWSSLRTPSGIGCTTVLGADEAALAAVKILSIQNHMIYGRALAMQYNHFVKTLEADANAAIAVNGENCNSVKEG